MAADTIAEVGGNTYRIAKLPVRQQLSVARRLSEVLTLLALRDGGDPDMPYFGPAFCGLTAHIPQADIDAVLDICLRAVTRKQGAQFAPVMAGNGAMMFADIELPDMLQLLWRVIHHNRLPDFFAMPPSDLPAPGAAGSSSPDSPETKTL